MRWFVKLFLILGVVSLMSFVVVLLVESWLRSFRQGIPFVKVVVEFVFTNRLKCSLRF